MNGVRGNWIDRRPLAPVHEDDAVREPARKDNSAQARTHRLRVAFCGVMLWGGLAGYKLVSLQVFRHQEMAQRAERQQVRLLKLHPDRGTMRDRNGMVLAASLPAVSLGADPKFLDTGAAGLLSTALGLPRDEIAARLDGAVKRKSRFVWIKRLLDEKEEAILKKDRKRWMVFVPDRRRIYPGGRLAAPIVGTVNVDGVGSAGVEVSQNSKLAGKSGKIAVLRDGVRRGIATLEVAKKLEAGKDVTLTVDAELQYFADSELARQAKEYGAYSGTAIIMDPHTGEVLALAAYPGFDPAERPRGEAALRRRIHPAVFEAQDPGSVMKLVTLAAALETTNLRARTWIPCGNGVFRFAGGRIGDTHAYSGLPMEQVIWLSSNVGAIHMGIAVGRERMKQYLRAFGIGTPTGIELPGEQPGQLNDRWRPSTLYYVSFGHEMTTTTVQLARLIAVFANGGYRIQPHLIKAVHQEGAEPGSASSGEWPKVRVIRADTAAEVRRISEGVILQGTAPLARVPGYTAGGKTGTAQMLDPKTKKYTSRYASTFMGLAPLSHPRVTVVVTLYGTSRMAGAAAAPLFSKLTGAALRRLGVEPDVPAEHPTPPPPRSPDARRLLAGNPAPPAAAPAPANASRHVVGTPIPNFQGMPKNEVLRESAVIGVPVEMVGNGLARRQEPPAGAVLGPGERIRVYFDR